MGLTQSELARRLGCTKQRVSQVLKVGTVSALAIPKWLAAVEGCDGPVADAARALTPTEPKPKREPKREPRSVHRGGSRKSGDLTAKELAGIIGLAPSRIHAILSSGEDYAWRIRLLVDAVEGRQGPVAEKVRILAPRHDVTRAPQTRRRTKTGWHYVAELATHESVSITAVNVWLRIGRVPERRRVSVAAWAARHRVNDSALWSALGEPCPFGGATEVQTEGDTSPTTVAALARSIGISPQRGQQIFAAGVVRPAMRERMLQALGDTPSPLRERVLQLSVAARPLIRQQDVAQEAGVSQSRLSQYIRAGHVPTEQMLERLLAAVEGIDDGDAPVVAAVRGLGVKGRPKKLERAPTDTEVVASMLRATADQVDAWLDAGRIPITWHDRVMVQLRDVDTETARRLRSMATEARRGVIRPDETVTIRRLAAALGLRQADVKGWWWRKRVPEQWRLSVMNLLRGRTEPEVRRWLAMCGEGE